MFILPRLLSRFSSHRSLGGRNRGATRLTYQGRVNSHSPHNASTHQCILLMDSQLIYILMKAVEDLSLDWSAPEQPARSHLDKWYLHRRHHQQSSHQRTALSFHGAATIRHAFIPPLLLSSLISALKKGYGQPSLSRRDGCCRSLLSIAPGITGSCCASVQALHDHLCSSGWLAK